MAQSKRPTIGLGSVETHLVNRLEKAQASDEVSSAAQYLALDGAR